MTQMGTLYDMLPSKAELDAYVAERSATRPPATPSQARDAAIAKVEAHAYPAWYAAALAVVRELADSLGLLYQGFTSDDVWAEVLAKHPALATHEPRALGAVLRTAQRHGWITPSSTYRPSTRTACHGRPVRVWHGTGR